MFSDCSIYFINETQNLSQNLSEGFSNRHVVAFFETSILKEVRILRYLRNHNLDTKFPQ